MPGKVILTGEHAVVYGKPALAASLGIGVKVKVTKTNDKHDFNEVVTKALEVAGADKTFKVEIESELPIGAGLGSSAAIAAAIIKHVKKILHQPLTEDELFALTMECEMIAHGNPSGLDPATVIYQGLIAYTKGRPFERLRTEQVIKLLLIDLGRPEESTKEMVRQVAAAPKSIEFIEKIGELVEQIRTRLGHGEEVADLLDQNGLLLEELGVVGERGKEISNDLRHLEYSVKITGAGGKRGGSGMMMAMGKDFAQAKKMLDNRQIHYFETTIGGI